MKALEAFERAIQLDAEHYSLPYTNFSTTISYIQRN